MTRQQLEDFHKKYPMEMMGLYQKYGVHKQPDLETTLDIIRVMGEPFLMDMFNIYHRQESFLGAVLAGAAARKKSQQEEGKEKGQLWNKFKTGFRDVLGLAKETKETLGGMRTDSGTQTTTPDGGSSGSGDGKIAGMSKGLFFGLVAAVVVVVVVVIINVRKG